METEVSYIIDSLYAMNSRDDGEQYLSSKNLKRGELETIARKLDIPFLQRGNVEKLRKNIVERTIGFRLRSKAIQGVNLKQNSYGYIYS